MKKTRKPGAFPVVGIGASAGGLKAFSDLLSALPPESGMAFVLVPHLAPQFKSHLTEILTRKAKLPVSEIESENRVSAHSTHLRRPGQSHDAYKGWSIAVVLIRA